MRIYIKTLYSVISDVKLVQLLQILYDNIIL